MKNIKLMLLIVISVTHYLMMMSSDSQMLMWMFMEIGNIMFLIFLFMMQNNTNIVALMAMIQFFSSALVLSGIIQSSSNLMTLGIIIKLGMFPAHNWLPMVTKESSWLTIAMILSLTKIPPFLMMSNLNNNKLIIMIMIMTSIVTSIKLIKINSMKMMMALSSMNHSSWMILCQSISMKYWIIYMMIYLINMIMICVYLDSCTYTTESNLKKKLATSTMLFSLMGLPPLTMFLAKLYIILINPIMLTLPMLSMIIASAISILFYSRIFIKSIFMFKKTIKISIHLKQMKTALIWIMFLLLLFMVI